MRMLIAPAPFKECLDARTVAETIASGLESVSAKWEFDILPLCDGGTGLVDRLIDARGGERISCQVRDPLMNSIESYYGILSDGTAVIESAAAAGLALVPRAQRSPLVTTTYGVGELLKASINRGCSRIIVGCGDSATNDAGVGMAEALGYRFYDQSGQQVARGGQALEQIAIIDADGVDRRLSNVDIVVACNITSILGGPEGTSRRYARQKGASDVEIESLAMSVECYADLLAKFLGWDMRLMPGTGAAGGLGSGLLAFAGARLTYSMTLVCEALDLDSHISKADMLITGEGMLDAGSVAKAPCAAALLAKKHDLPTLAIVGSTGDGIDIVYFHGIDAVEVCVQTPMSPELAVEPVGAKKRLFEAAVRAGRHLKRNAIAGPKNA